MAKLYEAKEIVCNRCGRLLPAAEFRFVDRTHITGYRNRYRAQPCRECNNAKRMEEYYAKRGERAERLGFCADCGVQIDTGRNGMRKRCVECKSKWSRDKLLALKSAGYKCRVNPEKQRRHDQRRLARKAGLPRTLTGNEWQDTLLYFGGACAYCGEPAPKLHQEHFVPLSKGGGYTVGNIVPACAACNGSKSDTMPLDWMVMQESGLVKYKQIAEYLEQRTG